MVGICLHQSHHQGCCQLIAIIKPLRPAQWRILRCIYLGLTDMGHSTYRPIHSMITAIHKKVEESQNTALLKVNLP
jgi:hypothetical protein